MFYITHCTHAEWLKRYPGLTLHPVCCPDCKETPWEIAEFTLWRSRGYVGVTRLCSGCRRRQDTATPVDRRKAFALAQACTNILGN